MPSFNVTQTFRSLFKKVKNVGGPRELFESLLSTSESTIAKISSNFPIYLKN